LILTILTAIYYSIAHGYKENNNFAISLMIRLGTVLILFGGCVLASYKDIRFIELCGPIFCIASGIEKFGMLHLGLLNLDQASIDEQQKFSLFPFLMYIGLFTTQFRWHVVIRLTLWVTTQAWFEIL